MQKLRTLNHVHGASLMAILVTGCFFDQTGEQIPIDANPNGIDAPVNVTDAPPGTVDASPGAIDAPPGAIDAPPGDPFCGWGHEAVFFDECVHPPGGPYDTLMLTRTDGPYIFDTTGGGELLDPDDTEIVVPSMTINGYKILWVEDFELGTGATLRVIGTRPGLIASRLDIDILGTLDASSYWDNGDDDYSIGAGAQPSVCNTNAADVGTNCNHGGAGGGGGGFGGDGGDGGRGGVTHTCNGMDGTPGGPGGGAGNQPNTTLRGGCDGKSGGNGDEDLPGAGGPGGGAISLFAGRNIVVDDGNILAGGAGGRGAEGGRSGGGGGGSGGMIGFEALSLTLSGNTTMAANGGAGGGGANNSSAGDGDDGQNGVAVATGGTPEGMSSAGGDGGWLSAAAENAQPAPDRGGGGGGGSVGYIMYYGVAPTTSGNPRLSPAATTAP